MNETVTATADTNPELLTARGEQFNFQHFSGPDGAPLLHWAHATGYNGATYTPLLAPLADQLEVLAWDARGHGFSPAAADPAGLTSWDVYRDDLINVIDALDRPLYLAGHSFGATISIAAAVHRPEKVLGLLLVEPVILNPWQGFGFWLRKLRGQGGSHTLARLSLKRRQRFRSRAAAVENYDDKGGFATWRREWIQYYVAGGMREAEQGVELTCDPEWESTSFAVTEHNAWFDIARLRCPVTVMVGLKRSTCDTVSTRLFRRLNPNARIVTVEPASHFLPMEYPDLVAAQARRLVPG